MVTKNTEFCEEKLKFLFSIPLITSELELIYISSCSSKYKYKHILLCFFLFLCFVLFLVARACYICYFLIQFLFTSG